MKKNIACLLLLAAETAAAHPGHGKPGLFHSHEEWTVAGTLVFLVAVAVIAWWRK